MDLTAPPLGAVLFIWRVEINGNIAAVMRCRNMLNRDATIRSAIVGHPSGQYSRGFKWQDRSPGLRELAHVILGDITQDQIARVVFVDRMADWLWLSAVPEGETKTGQWYHVEREVLQDVVGGWLREGDPRYIRMKHHVELREKRQATKQTERQEKEARWAKEAQERKEKRQNPKDTQPMANLKKQNTETRKSDEPQLDIDLRTYCRKGSIDWKNNSILDEWLRWHQAHGTPQNLIARLLGSTSKHVANRMSRLNVAHKLPARGRATPEHIAACERRADELAKERERLGIPVELTKEAARQAAATEPKPEPTKEPEPVKAVTPPAPPADTYQPPHAPEVPKVNGHTNGHGDSTLLADDVSPQYNDLAAIARAMLGTLRGLAAHNDLQETLSNYEAQLKPLLPVSRDEVLAKVSNMKPEDLRALLALLD